MRKALWSLAALLAVALALVGAAAWVVATEPGARWALGYAQKASGGKLALGAVTGTLARGVALEELRYFGPGVQLDAQEVLLRAALGRIFAGQLALEFAAARSVELRRIPHEAPPASAPGNVALPFELLIERLEVARLTLFGYGEPLVFRNITAHYEALQEAHRVRQLHFESPWGRVALNAEFGAIAPFPITASGAISRPDARYPAGAGIEARGTLDRLEADLTLSVGPDVVSQGKAVLTPLAEPWLAELQLQATDLDLKRFNAALPRTALDVVLHARSAADPPLAGSLSVKNRLEGREDGRLPIAMLNTRFATDFRQMRLEDLRLALSGGATLAGRAQLEPERARLALRSAEGIELDGTVFLQERAMPFEASLRLARFNPARLGPYPAGELSGTMNLRGRLGEAREIDVRWALGKSVLRERHFTSRGTARVSEQRVTRLDAQAQIGQSRLSARGAFGRSGDEVEWVLDAPRLEDLDPRLAGRLRAKGTLAGAWGSALVALNAQASGVSLPGRAAAQSVSVAGRFGQASDAPLILDIAATAVNARNIALERFSARVNGTPARHEAALRARGQGFDTQAQLRGGWREQARWSGELVALTNQGTYPLRLLAAVALDFSPESVALGRFDAALGEGRLLVQQALWDSGRLSTRGQFSGLPASWLLVPAGFGERVKSTLRLDGQWSIASAPRLTGEVSVRRTSGDLTLLGERAVELGLQGALLDMRFVDGELGIHAQAQSPLGSLGLQGELSPLPGVEGLGFSAQSPVKFKARFDFSELRALAAPYMKQAHVDGRLSAELQGTGTLERPVLTGSLNGEALRLDVPPYGVYLRDGRLRALLEGDSLRVTEFSLRGGEGTLAATGTLALDRNGARHLEWRATQLRLLNRPDMRLHVSGNGRVRLDGETFRVTGQARADRAYIELRQDRLPQLGDDVVVVGRPREGAREKARSPVELDMELDLGEDFALRGRGFDGKLTGRLRVVGHQNGALVATGKLRAVDATYLAYGRKLEVDPGTLIFDGPIDNPALQITAWRRNQAVEAGVQLTGTAQAPNVRIVSKPSVPEGERLSWLVLGRAPTDASGADLGLLQTAAGALLGRGSSVPVTDRIARAAGLDEVGLRGGGELSERVVAVGKRLSDRLYVSYEQGLGATATNLVKLDFALTERLSLRGETGTSSGWGLFYRFSWD